MAATSSPANLPTALSIPLDTTGPADTLTDIQVAIDAASVRAVNLV